MGLLNQGKGDKKKGNTAKPQHQGSKFIASKGSKPAGGLKKPLTGGANRGS